MKPIPNPVLAIYGKERPVDDNALLGNIAHGALVAVDEPNQLLAFTWHELELFAGVACPAFEREKSHVLQSLTDGRLLRGWVLPKTR
jgi:hypothetical protein